MSENKKPETAKVLKFPTAARNESKTIGELLLKVGDALVTSGDDISLEDADVYIVVDPHDGSEAPPMLLSREGSDPKRIASVLDTAAFGMRMSWFTGAYEYLDDGEDDV